jgi:hypothetical protein
MKPVVAFNPGSTQAAFSRRTNTFCNAD